MTNHSVDCNAPQYSNFDKSFDITPRHRHQHHHHCHYRRSQLRFRRQLRLQRAPSLLARDEYVRLLQWKSTRNTKLFNHIFVCQREKTKISDSFRCRDCVDTHFTTVTMIIAITAPPSSASASTRAVSSCSSSTTHVLVTKTVGYKEIRQGMSSSNHICTTWDPTITRTAFVELPE